MKYILESYNGWKEEIRLLQIEIDYDRDISSKEYMETGRSNVRSTKSSVESSVERVGDKIERMRYLQRQVKKVDVILDNDQCEVLKLRYIEALSTNMISMRYHVTQSMVYKLINTALATLEPYRAYFTM
ncbi:hypothetical protein [Cellulosilyticum sp. WCF-2]|uniref:hypothetical protein n=1 Tax=Cellulosilyticum sp. WCF-2 TaxID=2497860 RepID=UPI000F8CB3C8|nr:hypothetical protein [Cellulosilyticum sp. WCF-2]QEH70499.1 hypothetical protein EKH84_19675 [Cellulosilyticum sp. WCF-2]